MTIVHALISVCRKLWHQRRARRATVLIGVLGLLACGGLQLYRVNAITFRSLNGELDNGLKVMIQPDNTTAFVQLTMRYTVGSGHEPKEKKGIAHLVEHLAFRIGDRLLAAPAKPQPITDTPSAAEGATVGLEGETETPAVKKSASRVVRYLSNRNAHTSFDETFYWYKVVPPHVDDVLKTFARQMGDFSSRIEPEVLETERNVVRNERRSRYENQPLSRWWLDLAKVLFPADHPYHGDAVIGSHETIAAITQEDLSAFLEAHYHPGNATLTIIGPVDPDSTWDAVEKYFGNKQGRPPSILEIPNQAVLEPEHVVHVPEAKNAMLTVVWPLAARHSDEVLAMKTLDNALGGVFYGELVTERNWSFWASSWVADFDHGSMFVVQTLLRDPKSYSAVRSHILNVASNLGTYLGRQSFGRVRVRQSYDRMFKVESFNQRALAASRYFGALGTPLGFTDELNRMAALDRGIIRRTAVKLLAANRAIVLLHTPIDANAPVEAADSTASTASYSATDAKAGASDNHEERDTLPEEYAFEMGEESHRAWAMEAAQADLSRQSTTLTLPNGLQCRVIQSGSLPIMAVSVKLGGGSAIEARDKSGVTRLMQGTMSIAGEVARETHYAIGLRTYHDASIESIDFTYEVPSVYAQSALDMVAEAVFSPKIWLSSVQDTRKNMARAIGEQDTHVQSLAGLAYWRLMGLQQRHGVPTANSVSNLSLGDVRAFHKQLAYPENAYLSVVSNVPVDEMVPLVQKIFGRLKASGKGPWSYQAEPVDALEHNVALVPVRKSSQSTLIVAFAAPGWQDWQGYLYARAVAILLNTKLKRLRAAMGVTYGANASAAAFASYGMLQLSTSVQRDATDRALSGLWGALERVRSEPVAMGELERVRRGLIEGAIGGDESSYSIAKEASSRLWRGGPSTLERVQFVSGWSLENLQAAVDTLLAQPPRLVVAGQEPSEKTLGKLDGFEPNVVHFTPEEFL